MLSGYGHMLAARNACYRHMLTGYGHMLAAGNTCYMHMLPPMTPAEGHLLDAEDTPFRRRHGARPRRAERHRVRFRSAEKHRVLGQRHRATR